MAAGVPDTTEERLLDRGPELDRLRGAVDAAGTGTGSVVLIEGEAGIGKTRLLDAVGEMAAEAGFVVLRGRAGELERDFAWGIARQLYEPELMREPARSRAALLAGAAASAGPPLGIAETGAQAAPSPEAVADASFAACHGLYWLTANLSDRRPLILLVDDAHWSDSATLVFLNYLGRRIDELPIVCALALRPAAPGAPIELLAGLADLPSAARIEPGAITRRSVAALLESRLGRPDDAFVDACHDVTGGNPFLVEELIGALAAIDAPPDASSVEHVRRLGPRSISRSVLSRLGGVWPEALALAKAVAILDTDAELRYAAELAGLDDGVAASAADALSEARVLAPGRPLRFLHPVMRQAVYEDLPLGERSSGHAKAAQMLEAEGADPDRAAAHLMASEPQGSAHVVDRLREAAGRSMERGAPDVAARMLRRALDEPPSTDARPSVLLEAARAERAAGKLVEPVSLLEQASEESTEPGFQLAVARELAAALSMADVERAAATLAHAIDSLAGHVDPDDRFLAEAELLALGLISDERFDSASRRIEDLLPSLDARTPGARVLLAASGMSKLYGGGTAAEIAELATRALDGTRLIDEQPPTSIAVGTAVFALMGADLSKEALAAIDDYSAKAGASGSPVARCYSWFLEGRVAFWVGELRDCEAALERFISVGAGGPQLAENAIAYWVASLVEQGRLDAAEAALGPYRPAHRRNHVRAAAPLDQGGVEAEAGTNRRGGRRRHGCSRARA